MISDQWCNCQHKNLSQNANVQVTSIYCNFITIFYNSAFCTGSSQIICSCKYNYYSKANIIMLWFKCSFGAKFFKLVQFLFSLLFIHYHNLKQGQIKLKPIQKTLKPKINFKPQHILPWLITAIIHIITPMSQQLHERDQKNKMLVQDTSWHAGLEIATDMVANASTSFNLATKNSSSVATLATMFLW